MDAADLGAALGLGPGDHSAENVVSFEVYPDDKDADVGVLLTDLMANLAPFLEGYVWQREPFQLHPLPGPRPPPWAAAAGRRRGSAGPAPPPPPAAPSLLWGSLDFGDNVEDEWFAAWLLLELTRAFPVTARVWDNDGEFFLIEAAYSLPRWLKPETAPGRLWMRSGKVHLVPLELGRGELAPTAGLAAVCARGDVTAAAGAAIDDALALRLKGYPNRAHGLMHRAVAVVPAALAAVLAAIPQTAAAAVESFHYRDPYDARAARKMTHFPPQDMVRASLRLSRCLYAQIALQEWAPPGAWPPAPPPGHPDAAAVLLGAKLAAGYEMLLEKQQEGGEEKGPAGRAAAAVRAALRSSWDAPALAAAEVPPPDNEAWLREAPAVMEAELRRREAEVAADEARRGHRGQQQQPDFDPSELSDRMKEFVEAAAGLEGAEVPGGGGGVGFSEERFLAELQRVLDGAERNEDGDSSSDEGSSFYGSSGTSDSEGEEGEEGEGGAAARRAWAERAREEAWEAATATDSDDEGEEFMESYDAALAAQLEGTTLTQTFAAAGAAAGGGEAAGGSAESLRPVDVDANLVASLLASYQEQGGLPGPASNLAGLLGVRLPDPEPEEAPKSTPTSK